MYPLIPHPHKLLNRIESGSGNSKSISAISEQCSSFVKFSTGKIFSKLLRCRYILIPRYDIITFLPWNKNQLKILYLIYLYPIYPISLIYLIPEETSKKAFL